MEPDDTSDSAHPAEGAGDGGGSSRPWVAPPGARWAAGRTTGSARGRAARAVNGPGRHRTTSLPTLLLAFVAVLIVGAGVGVTMRGLTGLKEEVDQRSAAAQRRSLGEPVVDGGQLIISTLERFEAYELDGTTERWRGEGCLGARPAALFPEVVEGRLIVTCDGRIRELRTADGSLGWAAQAPGTVHAVRVSGRAVAVVRPRRLDVLDPATGEVRWQRTRANEPTALAMVGDLVVIREAGRLVAFDAATGGERWRSPLSPSWVSAGADVLWVRTEDSRLAAVDPADGTVRWQSDPDPERLSWSAIVGVTDGTIVVQDTLQGRVFGYDERDGSLRWSLETLTDPPTPLVAVGHGHVAIADGNGLTVLDAGEGTPVLTDPGIVPERPALVEGKVAYVDEADGRATLTVTDLPR